MLKTYHTESQIEVGLDESGRGPGLGRVYTAAVIWPPELDNDDSKKFVKDSKTIKSRKAMKQSYDYVIKNALYYKTDYGTELEIDNNGILKTNIASMHRCLDGLGVEVGHIIVDGNYFELWCSPQDTYPDYTTIIKGDSLYYSIAAASILAKHERDCYIENLCQKYPLLKTRYDILSNKGYLSPNHRRGLLQYGYSQFHRKTWANCKDLELNVVHPLVPLQPLVSSSYKK
jgi:ribonuclease HII